MKKILLLLFTIVPFLFHGQQIVMQNATVNNCSGTFFDSGGPDNNYSSNENFVLTICPETAGQAVVLNFTEFSTQLTVDEMAIYNGDSTSAPLFGFFSGTSSPGFVSANNGQNSSGCLTIQFTSNGSGTGLGWSAAISCIAPCQVINSQLDSATPMPNADGYIRVCQNEEITLNGSGIFEIDGTEATYEWDLGNGNTIAGQTATFSYDTAGVYVVNLNIRDTNTTFDPLGCANSNLINQVIQVAPDSDFIGTQALDTTLCFGETTTIIGVVSQIPIEYNCPPPVSDVTALPDGSGISYLSCLTVDCFESDAILTDISQIIDICINMEHSYLGDLEIAIVSPNGQRAVLKAYPGGGDVYLGGANNSDALIPGIGADYCFSMAGTVLLVDGPTVIAGSNPPNDSIAPGLYLPAESFDALLGSPINGIWCLEITDNLAIDNGFIFGWDLNLNTDIPSQIFSFTPETVSESWDADPSIIEVNGNSITVAPSASGITCYTFRVINDFGCESTEEICITVADQNVTPITYYADTDGDGFGDENNFIIECSDVAPQGYVANNSDCDDSNNLINPDSIDIEDNGIDENCDGVDGDILSITDSNFENISIYPNPFSSKIILNLPQSFNGKRIDISIYDLNSRLVYSKSQLLINTKVTLDNLEILESAPYFIKLEIENSGATFIRKLIKL